MRKKEVLSIRVIRMQWEHREEHEGGLGADHVQRALVRLAEHREDPLADRGRVGRDAHAMIPGWSGADESGSSEDCMIIVADERVAKLSEVIAQVPESVVVKVFDAARIYTEDALGAAIEEHV